MKKPNKYIYLKVVQGNYGQGWEDVTADEDTIKAKILLREYNENERQYPHRLITRRVG